MRYIYITFFNYLFKKLAKIARPTDTILSQAVSKIKPCTDKEFHQTMDETNLLTLKKVCLVGTECKESITTIWFTEDNEIFAAHVRWPNRQYYYLA